MERVGVFLIGRLWRHLDGKEWVLVEPGRSVRELALALGVRLGLVMVVVNGRRVPKSYILRPGDQAKAVLLVAGG